MWAVVIVRAVLTSCCFCSGRTGAFKECDALLRASPFSRRPAVCIFPQCHEHETSLEYMRQLRRMYMTALLDIKGRALPRWPHTLKLHGTAPAGSASQPCSGWIGLGNTLPSDTRATANVAAAALPDITRVHVSSATMLHDVRLLSCPPTTTAVLLPAWSNTAHGPSAPAGGKVEG